ncbi:MAG: glycosyltransferase family 4 protein, partial [Candidatus Methanomethylicus sp.]|nr:glycosyltransferase family 4 protein [Candidatus Methanomethylicus sp.]
MKLAFLLLHDFRFAGWSLEDFLRRTHFSKEYCKRLSDRGHDVILYMLHQDATSIEIYEQSGFRIKVFPVQFDFPPLPKFGYSHNLQVNRELSLDDPDLIHFNNYYLWSFPYVARWAKQNGKKIVCQYHGACDVFRPVRKIFVPIYQDIDIYLVARDDEIGYL